MTIDCVEKGTQLCDEPTHMLPEQDYSVVEYSRQMALMQPKWASDLVIALNRAPFPSRVTVDSQLIVFLLQKLNMLTFAYSQGEESRSHYESEVCRYYQGPLIGPVCDGAVRVESVADATQGLVFADGASGWERGWRVPLNGRQPVLKTGVV